MAIVSDIHGNLTAFDAVLADLRQTAPDLILHGGDLVNGGSGDAEVIDRIRDLGWRGVLGNTDEAQTRPESLEEFASQSKAPGPFWNAVREMCAATRETLGESRIGWLRTLPFELVQEGIALVHASPASAWRSPDGNTSEPDLEATYAPLGQPIAVYGHIHTPFIRRAGAIQLINCGSVSLSYDGDPRASYLLIDDEKASIRRVNYDIEKEIRALEAARIPHHDWIARSLRAAGPQMP